MPLLLRATGSKKELTAQTYYPKVADVLEHSTVQRLRLFRHHVHTTRFQHSVNVSYYSYLICRRFRWDAVSAARAGLLHDLYFYETCEYDRNSDPDHTSHFAAHPKLALQNAAEEFSLNEKEEDMILHHMWPAVPDRPRCKEGYVIVFVDKMAAIMEYAVPFWHKIKRRCTKAV